MTPRQSLRFIVVAKLFATGLVVSLLGGSAVFLAFSNILERELATRAHVLGNIVSYGVETFTKRASLQRYVSAVSAGREVNSIVVLLGEPLRVHAASNPRWLNKLADELPEDLIDRQLLRDVVNGGQLVTSRVNPDVNHLSFATPVRVYRSESNGSGSGEHGMVSVQLKSSLFKAELRRSAGYFALVLVSLILVFAFGTFILLRKHVLKRLQTIATWAASFSSIQSSPPPTRELQSTDELGVMTRTLVEAFTALSDKEQQFRSLVDNIPGVTFRCVPDDRGTLIFISPAIVELTGFPAHEFTEGPLRTLLSLIHPEDLEKVREAIANALRAGCPYILDYRMIRADGEVIFVYEKGQAVYGENGAARWIDGFVLDQTERKKTEEQIKQSWESAREALKRLRNHQSALDEHAIVAVTDTSANITYANAKFCNLSGYPESEVLGKPLTSIFAGELASAAHDRIWETLVRGQIWHGALCNMARSGKLYWVETTIVPFYDDSGNLLEYIVISTDISTRVHAEQEVHTAMRGMEQANRELVAAIERAEELAVEAQAASIAKSQFVATMSHEIRTPMNGVLGMVHLLLDTPLTSQQREYATIVEKCGSSLLSILNDILDFSKIEAGKTEIAHILFELHSLVIDTAELYLGAVHARNLDLWICLEADVPSSVYGDPGHLRQVLTNLIGNATKFTEQGAISVHVSREVKDTDYLRFEVRDNGVGIIADKLAALFQPFQQADASSTRRFGGTGLGLSICKRMVEMMGGTIGVESEYGVGSSFWFTIPLLPGPNVPADNAFADVLAGHRILVVDRDAISRRSLAYSCAAWGGHVVSVPTLEEGTNALQEAFRNEKPYGLVLWNTPRGIVDTTTAESRLLSVCACPVVILTPRANPLHIPVLPLCASVVHSPLTLRQLREACVQTISGQTEAPDALRLNVTHALQYHKLRVLVVDDVHINRIVAVKLLEKLGCLAEAVESAAACLSAVATSKYDIVLMDVQMPDMTGLEATQRLRHLPNGATVPVIALTAAAMNSDREACLAAGMNDYIAKPMQEAQLIKLLQRWSGSLYAADPRAAAQNL